jgi:hypothetical protein
MLRKAQNPCSTSKIQRYILPIRPPILEQGEYDNVQKKIANKPFTVLAFYVSFLYLSQSSFQPSGGSGPFLLCLEDPSRLPIFCISMLSLRLNSMAESFRDPLWVLRPTSYFFLPPTGKVYPYFHPFPPVSPLYPLPSIWSSHSRADFSLLKVRTRLKPLGLPCCSFLWSR